MQRIFLHQRVDLPDHPATPIMQIIKRKEKSMREIDHLVIQGVDALHVVTGFTAHHTCWVVVKKYSKTIDMHTPLRYALQYVWEYKNITENIIYIPSKSPEEQTIPKLKY